MTVARFATLLLCALGSPLLAQGAADSVAAATGHRFVQAFLNERFAEAVADFDSAQAARTSPERLRFIRMSIVGSLGPYKEQRGTRVTADATGRTVVISLAFERSLLDARLSVDTAGRITKFAFVPVGKDAPAGSRASSAPPPYSDTTVFSEREVMVGALGAKPLPGVLAIPKGAGPFPAVVLVHGAGPGNRDAGFGATRPFRDLAYGLASRGIVVLRYDKRSFADPQHFAGRVYTVDEEVVNDVLAAVGRLRALPEVDTARIFVLGHSLGAMLAPRIARRDPRLAGLILLAAPSRPLPTVIARQLEYLARHDSAAIPPARLQGLRADLARLQTLTPEAAADTSRILDAPPAYWLDLRAYDQTAVARKLRMPMLILQGERDFQVTASEDFAGWQRALAGRPGVTLKRYPNLNHLFVEGQGPSTYAEYQRPAYVSVGVIDDLAQWIRRRR